MILNWKHNSNNLPLALVRRDQLLNRFVVYHLPPAVCSPCYIFWKYMIITIHSGLNQEEIFEFGPLNAFLLDTNLKTSNSRTPIFKVLDVPQMVIVRVNVHCGCFQSCSEFPIRSVIRTLLRSYIILSCVSLSEQKF